jgi:hypothetical protein
MSDRDVVEGYRDTEHVLEFAERLSAKLDKARGVAQLRIAAYARGETLDKKPGEDKKEESGAGEFAKHALKEGLVEIGGHLVGGAALGLAGATYNCYAGMTGANFDDPLRCRTRWIQAAYYRVNGHQALGLQEDWVEIRPSGEVRFLNSSTDKGYQSQALAALNDDLTGIEAGDLAFSVNLERYFKKSAMHPDAIRHSTLYQNNTLSVEEAEEYKLKACLGYWKALAFTIEKFKPMLQKRIASLKVELQRLKALGGLVAAQPRWIKKGQHLRAYID